MTIWYSASLLYGYFSRADSKLIFVEESVVLVQAEDDDSGLDSAIRIGKEREIDDPSYTVDEVPAVERFLGVRKLVTVAGEIHGSKDIPEHGAELTYLRYRLEPGTDFGSLFREEPVKLFLLE